MGAPALENGPWNFDVNNDCSETATLDSKRHACWQTKESLAGFSAWSVVASSDSSSVKNIGDASPDLWTAWSNVVFGVGAHSWIILENSVTGEQLCIDCNTADVQQVSILCSATGAFNTDGTTSARPTSSETRDIITAGSRDALGATTLDGIIVHAMISNDSKCTRFTWHQMGTTSNTGDFVVLLEEAVNTPSQWTGSFKRVVYTHGSNISLDTVNTGKSPKELELDLTERMYAYLVDATPYAGWNGSRVTCECLGDLANSAAESIYGNAVYSAFLEGYSVQPIGLFRPYATRGGGIGRLQDVHWAHRAHDTYDTYDGSGSREWIKIGCLLLPWNGTPPLEVL